MWKTIPCTNLPLNSGSYCKDLDLYLWPALLSSYWNLKLKYFHVTLCSKCFLCLLNWGNLLFAAAVLIVLLMLLGYWQDYLSISKVYLQHNYENWSACGEISHYLTLYTFTSEIMCKLINIICTFTALWHLRLHNWNTNCNSLQIFAKLISNEWTIILTKRWLSQIEQLDKNITLSDFLDTYLKQKKVGEM